MSNTELHMDLAELHKKLVTFISLNDGCSYYHQTVYDSPYYESLQEFIKICLKEDIPPFVYTVQGNMVEWYYCYTRCGECVIEPICSNPDEKEVERLQEVGLV